MNLFLVHVRVYLTLTESDHDCNFQTCLIIWYQNQIKFTSFILGCPGEGGNNRSGQHECYSDNFCEQDEICCIDGFSGLTTCVTKPQNSGMNGAD